MAKGPGTTKKSSSSSPKGLIMGGGGKSAAPSVSAKPQKVNFGSAPSNYSNKTINVGDTEYRISAVPTGFGAQQRRNGRFTVAYNENYQDFHWGNFYGGYVSKSDVWRMVKDFIKKREKLV